MWSKGCFEVMGLPDVRRMGWKGEPQNYFSNQVRGRRWAKARVTWANTFIDISLCLSSELTFHTKVVSDS